MHQSCIIKVGQAWTLFVAGGKTREEWLNSTEMLDLTPYLRTGVKVKNSEGILVPMTSEWRSGPPMLNRRANFALVPMKDAIYAIGGIEGRDAKVKHRPQMSQQVCERYNIATDKWEPISIANLT